MHAVLASHHLPLQIVKRIPTPFEGDEWLFEIKHDAFRVLAIRGAHRPRIRETVTTSTSGLGASRHASPQRQPERFVFDRELVVLDDDGRSNEAGARSKRDALLRVRYSDAQHWICSNQRIGITCSFTVASDDPRLIGK
jgi:hypothetical protein